MKSTRQLVTEPLEPRRLLAANPMDGTFGVNGTANTNFDTFYERFNAVTVTGSGAV